MRWSWRSGRTSRGSRRRKWSGSRRCGAAIFRSIGVPPMCMAGTAMLRKRLSRETCMPSRKPIVILVSVVLICGRLASAQRMVGPIPGRDPTTQGVYVRDSAVAGEKLALAQRMEHLKEWDKSADVYQEIAEKFADRVVPVD